MTMIKKAKSTKICPTKKKLKIISTVQKQLNLKTKLSQLEKSKVDIYSSRKNHK